MLLATEGNVINMSESVDFVALRMIIFLTGNSLSGNLNLNYFFDRKFTQWKFKSEDFKSVCKLYCFIEGMCLDSSLLPRNQIQKRLANVYKFI